MIKTEKGKVIATLIFMAFLCLCAFVGLWWIGHNFSWDFDRKGNHRESSYNQNYADSVLFAFDSLVRIEDRDVNPISQQNPRPNGNISPRPRWQSNQAYRVSLA